MGGVEDELHVDTFRIHNDVAEVVINGIVLARISVGAQLELVTHTVHIGLVHVGHVERGTFGEGVGVVLDEVGFESGIGFCYESVIGST